MKHEVDKDALTINLLEPEVYLSLKAYPERLIEMVEKSKKRLIVIDEIQKAPPLLEIIHLLIEEQKNLQFIMTGSSVRKLRDEGVNLLGGRASVRYMHPYVAAELGEEFSLECALDIGLLPLIVNSKDPSDALDGYIYMYINPEIQMEGYIRRIDDFLRFLEVMSFSHGSMINVSNIAREAHVKRNTAENYIDILEDLLLGFRIDVLVKKTNRELVAHPKFYFFDVGVYRRIRPRGRISL